MPGEQGNDDQENDEGGLPALVDGGYLRDTPLSEDVLVRDVVPADSRFFRLDDLLLLCIEFVKEDFPHDVEVSVMVWAVVDSEHMCFSPFVMCVVMI